MPTQSWARIAHRFHDAAVLLGNGFSTNIEPAFGYRSLRYEAGTLTPQHHRLFDSLEVGDDFERVLESLTSAIKVDRAIGRSPGRLMRLRTQIRDALLHAVNAIHPPPATVDRIALGTELRRHRQIFTTNYDLLTIWGLTADRSSADLRDHFPHGTARFSPDDDRPGTELIYLHGALHLWHDPVLEETGRLKAGGRESLLSQIARNLSSHPDRQPLFVSEGTARDKRRRIDDSPYLRFALERLTDRDLPLIVLGFAFSENDRHVLEAIRATGRPVAVGVHRPGEISGRRLMARVGAELDDVTFFSASEHPLTAQHFRR